MYTEISFLMKKHVKMYIFCKNSKIFIFKFFIKNVDFHEIPDFAHFWDVLEIPDPQNTTYTEYAHGYINIHT